MSQHEALEFAANAAINWIDGLSSRPAGATVSLETMREKLDVVFPEIGIPAREVISDLVESTRGGLLGSAGGRFYAWVIGGSLPSALAADWLTSAWDQNAALYACGPAVSVVEEIAGQWLKELLDLPRDASFAFTTGCQLAHFTCLAAARSSVLKKVNWNVNENGLFGAPSIRVLTSEHRHGSIDRAIRYLGFGNKSLVALPTSDSGQVECATLETDLKNHSGPTILVLDAADLNIAAFDPFKDLIPLAKSYGAWVHVDGAFGLFARASKAKRHLTQGIELADSWATDGHKWLNVPFDCGLAIVKDRQAHREAMTVSASYISPESSARDQIDWNPEWSRRARGVAVYAALRELGREGVEKLIDQSCRYCNEIVTGIGKLKNTEVLWEPKLNQGLVRFIDPTANANDSNHDRKTEQIIKEVNESGEAFFSGTTWKGKRAMRVSVVNWRTTDDDVKRAVTAVERALLNLG